LDGLLGGLKGELIGELEGELSGGLEGKPVGEVEVGLLLGRLSGGSEGEPVGDPESPSKGGSNGESAGRVGLAVFRPLLGPGWPFVGVLPGAGVETGVEVRKLGTAVSAIGGSWVPSK
jgi:hypothetical protein